jgi:hypothetical protein
MVRRYYEQDVDGLSENRRQCCLPTGWGGGLAGGGLFLINAFFRGSVRGPDETAGPFMVNWFLGFVPGAVVGMAAGVTVVQ